MKNSNLLKFIVLAIIVFGVWSYFKKDQLPLEAHLDSEPSQSDQQKPHSKQIKAIDQIQTSTTNAQVSNDDLIVIPPFVAQNKDEESLGIMSVLMKESLSLERESQDLVRELDKLQLAPEHSVDANPYTGDMAIIRTKKNLPGTRYFHAQYFKDESGREFLQHMSFEFKGGPGAFERAKAAAHTMINLGKPVKVTKDFIQWNISEDRELWIKVMSEKDLLNDPYNAYTKEDVGTIRLAIEKKIHDDQHQDHIENQ